MGNATEQAVLIGSVLAAALVLSSALDGSIGNVFANLANMMVVPK